MQPGQPFPQVKTATHIYTHTYCFGQFPNFHSQDNVERTFLDKHLIWQTAGRGRHTVH